MSYLKDLPCASCGTESTYYFPDKPTAHYCYCDFRFEIGEQIAREIGELPEYTETEAYKRAAFYLDRDDVMNAIARGEYEPQQSKMSANNNIFRGVVVISKSG